MVASDLKVNAIACIPKTMKPTDATIKAWTSLLRAHSVTFSFVEAALKDQKQPPLAWYDVLLELERVGEKGMRPFELQNELLLPQYGTSRLLGRLEKAGYIKSHACEGDGRGQTMVITPLGRQVRKQMWAVYSKAIEQVVGRNLDQAEAKTLSMLHSKLISPNE